ICLFFHNDSFFVYRYFRTRQYINRKRCLYLGGTFFILKLIEYFFEILIGTELNRKYMKFSLSLKICFSHSKIYCSKSGTIFSNSFMRDFFLCVIIRPINKIKIMEIIV